MNHTEFGNLVLGVWTDTSRWDAVVTNAQAAEVVRPTESHHVWGKSFDHWLRVRDLMLEHASRIFTELRPLRAGEGCVAGFGQHVTFCTTAAQLVLQHQGRYKDWVEDVEHAVADVNGAVDRVHPARTTQTVPEDTRGHLEALARAGRRLKEVFSGRGYFNHAESD